MVSGLKVNFWKSSLIGINVTNEFMEMAATFLNCRVGRVPFRYLGLPVGANPRLMTTWQPMLEVIRNRIWSWGNKFLSFGGRFVLLNAVLNAVPIFYLSYLRMPAKVWKEIVKIQQRFLWSGLSLRRRISWVKWEDVCKPKIVGGLGVRDLNVTNLSLLSKWRWKLLHPEEELWKTTVMAKYGGNVVGVPNLGEEHISRGGSSWWRNICLLDKSVPWFEQAVFKTVGNGNNTKFWSEVWVENQTLSARFPRLFLGSEQKNVVISEMGYVQDGWRWVLKWRRGLFEWEKTQLQDMLRVIDGLHQGNDNDR
jgi:hypothetical protein